MKRIYLLLLLCLIPALSRAQEVPVVIAIADIQNLNSHRDRQITVRDRVVAELLQKYECCVLSRMRSYDLAREGSLAKLQTVETLGVVSDFTAASHVVSVSLEPTTRGSELAGIVTVTDLNEDHTSAIRTSKLLVRSETEVHTSIVKNIASMLSLKERGTNQPAHPSGANDLTWLVLPFAGTGKGDAIDPHAIELALQEARVAASLVDRVALEEALSEKILRFVNGSNEALAGSVGRLVGADRILTGTMSGSRLDVFVVDAKSGAIVASTTTLCEKDNLMVSAKAAAVAAAWAGQKDLYVPLSSSAQRKREADLYLSTKYMSNSRPNMAKRLADTEAAYLLAGDDHECLTAIVNNFCEIVSDGIVYNNGPDLARRAGTLADRILKEEEYSGCIPDPILARAEIQMHFKNYDEALRLATLHSERYPGVERPLTLWILAKCNLELDQVDRAASLMRTLQVENKEWIETGFTRWGDNKRILIREIEAKTDVSTPAERYEKIKAQLGVSGYIILPQEWEEYMQLLVECEEPKDAIPILQAWIESDRNYLVSRKLLGVPGDAYARVDALLAQAECFLKNGSTRYAVNNAKAVKKVLDALAFSNGSQHIAKFAQPNYDKAVSLIIECAKKIGTVEEINMKLSAVAQFPEKYRVYFIPVGKADERIIQLLAGNVADFFGADIRLLPPLQLPEAAIDERSFQLQSALLWHALLQDAEIPQDAIAIVFITSEDIGASAVSLNDGNPLLLSYKNDWHGDSEPMLRAVAGKLAIRMALSFRYSYMAAAETVARSRENMLSFPRGFKQCSHYPCLATLAPDNHTPQLPMEFCPACQNEYKNVDFDKIHNDLMTYLKNQGTIIVSVDKER